MAGRMPMGLISLMELATEVLFLLSKRVLHMNQYLGMLFRMMSVAMRSATTSLTLTVF